MKYLKKLLAAGLAACTLFTMAACSDTSWVFDYDGTKIPAGLYLEMTMEAYNNAKNHKDINDEETDLFKQTLDGKDARQWMLDEAKDMADSYIASEKLFDELGLTLSEDDLATISNNVETTWASYSATYEKNGVGKANYTLAVTNALKKQKLFDKYYAEGGLEEVKEADIKSYYNDNYVTLNMFSVTLATGDELTDEQKADNEARKKSVDEYLKAINDGTKTFNEVQDQFNHTYLSFLYGETHDESNSYDTIGEDKDSVVYVTKDSEKYEKEVIDALFALKPGDDAKAIEKNGTYYIAKRYSNDDYFDKMKDTVLYDMKREEFTDRLREEAAKMTQTANSAAVGKYDPRNIDLSTES